MGAKENDNLSRLFYASGGTGGPSGPVGDSTNQPSDIGSSGRVQFSDEERKAWRAKASMWSAFKIGGLALLAIIAGLFVAYMTAVVGPLSALQEKANGLSAQVTTLQNQVQSIQQTIATMQALQQAKPQTK